jgi:hypothetical protein
VKQQFYLTSYDLSYKDDQVCCLYLCKIDLTSTHPTVHISNTRAQAHIFSFVEKLHEIYTFSWGYICSQILGGRLAELFGFKLVYGLGTVPHY